MHGVEDTRLEAKAKDTKKKSEAKAKDSLSEVRHSRGQGQEMLEAKAKDQGHKHKVLSKKKKVFTKIFQAISKEIKIKKRSSQKFFKWSPQKKRFPKIFSSAPQNFNNSKNSAVLEPRTGQFSRTWGLEAKAKDLTFEAKAKTKDFKMCPRGLHLCQLPTLRTRVRFVIGEWMQWWAVISYNCN